MTRVVGSRSVRRRDRAMEPRKLKDQRRMQRFRARKRCAGLWGVSQHRARAPHATAAGGLRAIWPGCVAVRSKGPLSTEHAYIQVNKAPICDVRRTLSMCTVYFLVRVRMACQRLAAGIVHDDDACTARTRRQGRAHRPRDLHARQGRRPVRRARRRARWARPPRHVSRAVRAQRFGQRPTVTMVPPATTPHGSAWTASQREVLRLVLEEHVNVQITGEPGAGKTEVASALMVTLQAAGVDFMLVSLSNMIFTSFLRKR